MLVLKVVAEGITTSFRYPHFMQQIQPTFSMPPPATIYGHICSVLGEWFDPRGVQFAYHFTAKGQVKDKEHVIVLTPAGGFLPDTSRLPKVLEGNINPFDRDLLFQPRLTLYINRPEWKPAFLSPRYVVALGRSQDLFTYTRVEVLNLEQAETAYFEHTLAPHSMSLQIGRGVVVLMPRYLDYQHNRAPVFERYVVVQERLHLPNEDGYQFESTPLGPFWVDVTTVADRGTHLGLVFHSFVDG